MAEPYQLMIRGDALRRSLYAGQLEGILACFERSQVLVLQYERCVREPAAELERTFVFLGLEVPAESTIENRPSSRFEPEMTGTGCVAPCSVASPGCSGRNRFPQT